MGRPPKLTDRQGEEVVHRLLRGETVTDLAREFGVSKSALCERYGPKVRTIRAAANELLRLDQALRALSPLEELAARRMAGAMFVEAAADRQCVAAMLARYFSR